MALTAEELNEYEKAFSALFDPDAYEMAFSGSFGESEAEPGYGETLARGLGAGALGIGKGIGATTRWAGDVAGIEPVSEAGKVASEYYGGKIQDISPKGPSFKGTFVENPRVKKAAFLISQAVPSLAAALTIGTIAGPAAAATGLGLLEGSPQYEEARAKGLTVAEASAAGVASTAGTALLEYLPISMFLKGLKGGIIARAGKGFVAESGQEASQQLWQNMVAKYGYDKTQSLAEGLVESAIAGGGAGAMAGVVLESHLTQVCENHNIKITKKDPTVNDLNDLLKTNDIIEVST